MTYDDVLVSSEHGNPVIMCNDVSCVMSTADRVRRVKYREGRGNGGREGKSERGYEGRREGRRVRVREGKREGC